MSSQERIFNLFAGATVLSWSCAIVVEQLRDPAVSWSPWVVAALHAVVGLLFLLRGPERRRASVRAAASAAPGVLVAGFAATPTAQSAAWPLLAEAVFATGGALAVVGLLCLGRSFAVLPSVRSVVDRGLYRFLRHPVYLGEGLMLVGCLLAEPGPGPGALCLAAAALLSLRVRAEERALLRDPGYAAYCRRVPWRWLPGVL